MSPARILMSNTPERALLYSAVKAPRWKSELSSTLELSALTSPVPMLKASVKWFGLKISTPSSRHCMACGALPCTDTPLSLLLPATPAKAVTRRAGSLYPPAYRLASSMLSILAPTRAILFTAPSLLMRGFTTTSPSSFKPSLMGTLMTTSLPSVTRISGMTAGW